MTLRFTKLLLTLNLWSVVLRMKCAFQMDDLALAQRLVQALLKMDMLVSMSYNGAHNWSKVLLHGQ